MRNKHGRLYILAVLAMAMVLTLGTQLVASADEGDAAQAAGVVELTLEDAIRLAVANSSSVKTANLDRRLAEISLIEQNAQGEENVSAEAKAKTEKAYADAQEAVVDAIKSVALSVEQSYYSLLKAFDRVASAERSLEAQQRQLEIVKVKYEAGIEAKNSYDTAVDNVTNAEKSLASAKFSLETELIRFNSSLGLDVNTQVVLVDKFEFQPVEVTLEESIAFALENRDDIKSRVQALEDARKALDRAVQIPGSTKIDIEKAEISVIKAEMQLESTRINAIVAVRNSYTSLQNAADAVVSAQKALDKAQETLDKTKARYEAGLATLNSVSDAERSLVEAEIKLAQSVYDYNNANASFCQAIGKDYVSIDALVEANGQ